LIAENCGLQARAIPEESGLSYEFAARAIDEIGRKATGGDYLSVRFRMCG